MKIEDVKKLDDGVSNITIEGKIIKTPKEPRDSEFGWSQMIILKDDTDEISSWINIESAEDAYKVGQYIKIKGKVSKYVKGGKPGISLNNGNVIDEIKQVNEDVPQEKQKPMEKTVEQPITQPVKSEKDMDKVWEGKDLRMARESALKNVAKYVVAGLVKLGNRFDYAEEGVDFIYNGLGHPIGRITSEAITKELGGTVEESVNPSPELSKITKEERIEEARELVRNPHLTEPVNDKMATVKQKKQTYGYINEEGKKIGGIIHSQYLTKKEAEGIGEPENLTKSRAIAMWEKWYGKEGEMGERDKRELEAKDKEEKANPFTTKEEPIEKKDKDNDASLSKDMLIDEIQAKRKELHLEDDEKFEKEIGYNTSFKNWTEKELTKLNELLKDWKPNWVREK